MKIDMCRISFMKSRTKTKTGRTEARIIQTKKKNRSNVTNGATEQLTLRNFEPHKRKEIARRFVFSAIICLKDLTLVDEKSIFSEVRKRKSEPILIFSE